MITKKLKRLRLRHSSAQPSKEYNWDENRDHGEYEHRPYFVQGAEYALLTLQIPRVNQRKLEVMPEESCPTFVTAFKENMEALGMPVPDGVFESQAKILELAGALAAPIKELGATATLGELLGATTATEGLLVAAGVTGAAYAGAVVGSAAVATARSLTCAPSILDVFSNSTNTARSLDELASIKDPDALMAALNEYAKLSDGQEFALTGGQAFKRAEQELMDAQASQGTSQVQISRGIRI